MTKKTTTLCAFALIFAGSPLFAQECSKSGNVPCQQVKTGGMPGTGAVSAQGKTEKTKAEKQKKGKAEKAVLRKVTSEEIGKEAVCPVTGEKLAVKADTGSASYKGKIYYFCCPGCDKSFLANPEKFVSKKPAAEAKNVYVCPMGDYQGDKPGKCPKCGMTLEEKK